MKIGFIGCGVMGSSMVRNLLKASYEVNVYNRTPSKAMALKEDGAKFTESIKDCVLDVDVVITIVSYPSDVESCYEEIIKYAKDGAILIDMTTSSPSLAIDIYNKAKEYNLYALDAPVSGGDIGAKEGKLTIMVGGDKEVFDKAYDLFKAMGETITYIGKAGSGQHTKMANQIAIAGNIAGSIEAMTYAIKQGLDIHSVYNAISKGSAGSFQLNYAYNKIKANDFKPGFFIKHFIKDMRIAKDEMAKLDIKLNTLNTVLAMFEELEKKDFGDKATQALIYFYLNEVSEYFI